MRSTAQLLSSGRVLPKNAHQLAKLQASIARRQNIVDASMRTMTTKDASTPSDAKSDVKPTTHYRITLRRSGIGMPSKIRNILSSMGLNKRLQTIYRLQRPEEAGNILAVKELVHVDTVRRLDGGMEEPLRKYTQSGFEALSQEEVDAISVSNEDAIWVDQKGEVVDWGYKGRRAPRGYTVVGNLGDEKRHAEIKQGLQGSQ
ncbi:hypothetical protein IE81DRAFT_320318 [Ceraceosorus guamensis]|uniref:Large ribosomal subunit protein uL30m n=1 Tax=Ceraceosorus guamensis TaxID=1522189 RepID=A0A316W6J5_9BASI|nr:hypothetical protein IE81DRAFT_320318 [Ceraceosorus guamensis]PWN45550.1 hypothetical protein IE81DRAFT_320318 [Ceraceosorus guamensis]